MVVVILVSLSGAWQNLSDVKSKNYVCGYCGKDISSHRGYFTNSASISYVLICHHCNRPSFYENTDKVYPGSSYGNDVQYINVEEVSKLYDEARSCISCNAYTASVLCSRKLIMNIAVTKGADENLSFIKYVEFLSEKGYIPPDGKEWVDHIRKKGNQATHEIEIMSKDDAIELIDFLEMLLKFVYEFPAIIHKKNNSK